MLKKPSVTSEMHDKNKFDIVSIKELRFEMNKVSEYLKDWESMNCNNNKTSKTMRCEVGKEVKIMKKLVYKFNNQWRREKALTFFKQVKHNIVIYSFFIRCFHDRL